MPVTPEVRIVLDLIAAAETVPIGEQTPEQVRESYAAMAAMATREEVGSVADLTVPGPAGAVDVRAYAPAGAGDGPWPVLVYMHGGGWTIGSIETHDHTCRSLADGAGVLVVSVGYRLAPEHPFPAGVDDVLAAVRWVAAHAGELGGDGTRLAVGGDSAGGNLAAVAAQQLRDGGPAIGFQLLLCPATDMTMSHPSIDENGEGYFLTREAMVWFRGHYLGDRDRADPLVSPLLAPAEALAGLPPALVITAEFDPLRDEGEAYAAALRSAGVAVSHSGYAHMIHDFFWMPDVIPEGKTALDEACAAVRAALT